MIPVLL